MNLNNLNTDKENQNFVVAHLDNKEESAMKKLENMATEILGDNHFIVIYEKKEK